MGIENPAPDSKAGLPSLVLKGISRSFGSLKAVNDIHLSVEQGARCALIGPNGAGKTTLINLISGELHPTAGQIFHCGEEVTRLAPHRRAALGIARTFQITNLFPNLTVGESILLACQALEKTKFVIFRPLVSYRRYLDKALDLLKQFDLYEKKNLLIKNLSHGDHRQIEVALALAGQPRLLLLDEPAAGLSLAESHDLTRRLKNLDPAVTLIIIEHDLDVAFEVADRIVVMHQGKKLVEGSREEIKKNPVVQQIYLGGK
jgi:branched-chain amino acid transport system ATP-binding protein